MGKETFATRMVDKHLYISLNDTMENILVCLTALVVYTILKIDPGNEKSLRKKICDMIMSAPTDERWMING